MSQIPPNKAGNFHHWITSELSFRRVGRDKKKAIHIDDEPDLRLLAFIILVAKVSLTASTPTPWDPHYDITVWITVCWEKLPTDFLLGIANGGVPGRGFSNSWTCCVSLRGNLLLQGILSKLLKIDLSLAIATSGLRTNLLFEMSPFQKKPFDLPISYFRNERKKKLPMPIPICNEVRIK